MISSMTGFGRGTAQVDDVTAKVEMRSVNSRFCEVSMRLPGTLAEYENKVQAQVKQALERGRINVQVQIEAETEETLPIQVDTKMAHAYGRLLENLRSSAGVNEPVRLEDVMTFSEVFTTTEAPAESVEQMWEAVQDALAVALDELKVMRRQEGRALRSDLEARIDAIEQHLDAVEARAPKRVTEAHEHLHERLQELIEAEEIDRERIEHEIAILADKLDVTEECVRLRSHLQLFRESLASDDAVGRKLKFISQEIHREVNTIGAKANDTTISHLAVSMKEELEKIREQIQNVE